jgi:hypothetical protein
MRPDLAALEFQLPVNMVNGERRMVQGSHPARGFGEQSSEQGEGDKEKGSTINHEPLTVNRQLSMDSLLDDAAQNQNPSLPD